MWKGKKSLVIPFILADNCHTESSEMYLIGLELPWSPEKCHKVLLMLKSKILPITWKNSSDNYTTYKVPKCCFLLKGANARDTAIFNLWWYCSYVHPWWIKGPHTQRMCMERDSCRQRRKTAGQQPPSEPALFSREPACSFIFKLLYKFTNYYFFICTRLSLCCRSPGYAALLTGTGQPFLLLYRMRITTASLMTCNSLKPMRQKVIHEMPKYDVTCNDNLWNELCFQHYFTWALIQQSTQVCI